jgi:hypothetical protein
MSATGPKRIWRLALQEPAFDPKQTLAFRAAHVRLWPSSDIVRRFMLQREASLSSIKTFA